MGITGETVTFLSVSFVFCTLVNLVDWCYFQVRCEVMKQLAFALRSELEAVLVANDDAASNKPYEFSAAAAGRRALKNKALAYLAMVDDAALRIGILDRFRAAGNMTDAIGALGALLHISGAKYIFKDGAIIIIVRVPFEFFLDNNMILRQLRGSLLFHHSF